MQYLSLSWPEEGTLNSEQCEVNAAFLFFTQDFLAVAEDCEEQMFQNMECHRMVSAPTFTHR